MKNKQNQFINPETEKEIDELLSKMTVKEKIGQLHQLGTSPVGGFEISKGEMKKLLEAGRLTQEDYDSWISNEQWDENEELIKAGEIGSFLGRNKDPNFYNHLQRVAVEESRLGIPLIFGNDVIHGHKTIFPIPLAESCTFEDELFELSAEIAAKEAAAEGIHWTFAPMLDIARDARWGRVAESAGEDTYLATRYATAKVKGFQGENVSDTDRIVACAKHFVAYGAAEGGRDYNSVDMSLQKLWNVYLPPFKAACEAGAGTFMSAFNDLNGVPCTANAYLLRTVLREKFGFNGFVVSDAFSIDECVAHGVATDRKVAAELCLNAGVNMDMVVGCYRDHIEELLSEGKISEDTLNEAVREVLRIKYAKGLFEHPYTDVSQGENIWLCDEHRRAALEIAEKSIVLLKNDDKILPLKSDMKIAVVGELADDALEMLGTWVLAGESKDTVSLVDALKSLNIDFVYEPCCGVDKPFDVKAFEAAISGADVVLAAVGELKDMSGEASSLCNIDLHGEQKKMIEALHNSTKPFVTLLFNGRPLAIKDVADISPAVVECWHLGTEAGNAICNVLFGKYNPSGRLTTTFPNYSGECPVYYNHLNTGRPTSEVKHSTKYMDAPLKPLFPFGYGLSYTEYEYDSLSAEIKGDRIEVSVEVKNIGDTSGVETVQFYVQDVVASMARPVRELKEYKKVALESGETATVKAEIPLDNIGYYNERLEYVVEPGEFEIFVGHDSEAQLCTSVFVQG